MTSTSHPDILAIFEKEFPKDPLVPGEAYLTLAKFHALLKARRQSYGRATIYRWLKVRKEFLPQAVQDILKPAPSVWFINSPLQTEKDRHTPIIPLRYLSESVHSLANTYAERNTTQHEVLIGLHVLQSHLNIMQRQLNQLIDCYPDLHRKDEPHAKHRTGSDSPSPYSPGQQSDLSHLQPPPDRGGSPRPPREH